MKRAGSRGCYNKFSSPFTMSLGCIPSRIALVLRLLLSASCAIALHMPSGSHDSTVSGLNVAKLAGCLYNATTICTAANIPDKSLMSILEEGSHVSDMTIYNGICQVVWRADSDKLIPLFSEGIFTGVGHWLNEVKYGSHGKAKGPLYFWPHQNEEDLLKGDIYKINRIPRIPKEIETLDKESANLRLALHDEDWICLRVDNIRNDKSNLRLWIVFHRRNLKCRIWPTSRDNLVLTSIHEAVFNDLMKIYCNDLKTELPDVAQVPKRGSVQAWEYVLIHTPFREFSRRDKIVNMTRARFSQEATGKVAGREDHVGAQRNIQVEELSNMPNDGRQSLAWRGRLLQAVTPNVAPITSPVVAAPPPVVTPVEAPPPITTPVKSPPPPVTTILKSPPPPVTTPVTSPPPPIATPVTSPPPPITTPVKSPPHPVMTPVTSPPPPSTTPVSIPPLPITAPVTSPPPPSMTPSPLPSESSPLLELPPPDVYTPVGTPILESPPPANAVPVSPTYSLDIPPADDILLKPTIVSPDSWKIGNVSVYVTGVYIPFISIRPSGILLMKEATRKRHRVQVSHNQQYTRQFPKPVRRLFQALTPAMMPTEMMPPTMPPAMMPAAMTVPPPPAPPTWMPKSPGVSPYLLMFLQVDAGSLLIPLPSWLLWNAKHQPTDNDQWIPLMNDSIDSFQLVPGAGIQFMGTVEQINEALLDLEFGLGLGNGKTKDVNLVVMAVHQYVNLTSIIASTAKKTIVMNVVGAGAWFIVFQYTKAFYNSAVGVLLFFALSLILLCCILGCCMCHDTKMEKVFQANKAALKSQNLVFNETRVFNPVWIPSAVVGPGRGRFIIFHNPKFLQKRLAEHLSSLHGAVVEKVVTVTDYSKVEESLGLQDVFGEGSENSPLSSTTQESMSPSGTSQADDGEEGGSQSTHYTIKEDRAPGSPLSMTDISVGSGSTHYDIGSPRIASDSEETESTRG